MSKARQINISPELAENTLPDTIQFDFGKVETKYSSAEETRWYEIGRACFIVSKRHNTFIPTLPTYWVRMSASPQVMKRFPDVTFTTFNQVVDYMALVGTELWEEGYIRS